MKKVTIVLMIPIGMLAACGKSNQLVNYEKEIREQVAKINPDLIRRPSPDEVRREEFSSIPPLDFSATSLSQDAIRGILNDEKERLISDYISEEVSPKINAFTAKWNPILTSFHSLSESDKRARIIELDRDLASLEKIDNRFQTVVLKAILQKSREIVDKLQLNLANIESSN